MGNERDAGAISVGAGSSGISAGFSIVVAMDRKRGIGKDGKLPWKLSGDIKFFKELTTCPDSAAVEKRWGLKPEESGEERSWDEVSTMLKFAHKLPEASDEKRNAVIMGRKTWESLPENFRPLPDRKNVVLSALNLPSDFPGVGGPVFWGAFEAAVSALILTSTGSHVNEYMLPGRQAFVIGGGQVFIFALKHPGCAHLYLTEIDAVFDCDTSFPEIPADFRPVLSSPWIEENGIRYRFRRYDRVS